MTTHIVQIEHAELGRRIALVEEPQLRLLAPINSVYELAQQTIRQGKTLSQYIDTHLTAEVLEYDAIYEQRSPWKLLPAFDRPDNPAACIVSGTGLTHKSSAMNRQHMHQMEQSAVTDSMRMYQWGLEGGHPAEDKIGAQPEWFYKGQGHLLRAHGQPLPIPPYADDGGEEPEVAGLYVVDAQGQPRRVGFCTANEFSDHKMEKKNYLYLAPSKLRNCAIGPELVIDHDFQEITGRVSIYREGDAIWSKEIHTGEKYMAHSLANLEYHQFKYESHRIPGQAHVHFMGADAFSFGEQVSLQHDDRMEIYWEGMGRALSNTLTVDPNPEKMFKVEPV